MTTHGAFRKGTEEYRKASSVVRGEHMCPECCADVVVRRNKQCFYWTHRAPTECLYYAPEPECPQELVRNHLIRAIAKEYRAGNYTPRVEIKSSSLPYEGPCDSDEFLRGHGIPSVVYESTDAVVFNYTHGAFVFDVAVVGADGRLKTATCLYDVSDEGRNVPSDLEWIEYSSANL